MKIGVSNIPSIPLMKEIELISELGFDHLELYIGRNETSLNEIEKEKKKILDAVSNKDLEIVGHLTSYDISIWNESPNLLFNCLDLFAALNVKLATLHTRVETGEEPIMLSEVTAAEVIRKVLKICLSKAEEYGMTLCTENTDEPIEYFVELFNEFPRLHFTLDIGHANLNTEKNNSLLLLDTLGERLEHIHCHDNLGGYGEKWDLHLPIGVGNIDFKSIFSKLHNLGYDKRITLEIFAHDRRLYLEVCKKRIEGLWRKG